MLVVLWAARVFALTIAVQVFIAGMALFVNADWTAHTVFARSFVILPIVMILVSFIGRLPVTYRLRSIQLLVMVILMFVTAVLSSVVAIISAFHPVIAVAMFWSAMTLAKLAAADSGAQRATG